PPKRTRPSAACKPLGLRSAADGGVDQTPDGLAFDRAETRQRRRPPARRDPGVLRFVLQAMGARLSTPFPRRRFEFLRSPRVTTDWRSGPRIVSLPTKCLRSSRTRQPRPEPG